MSIRTRLVLLCLTLALLPAIPVSLVVSDMIDRSFDVGLSSSVSDAIEGGMAISRKYLERLREDFEEESQVFEVLGMRRPGLEGSPAVIDTAFISEVVTGGYPPGARGFMLVLTGAGSQEGLERFSSIEEFSALIAGRTLIERDPVTRGTGGVRYFETEDRAVMIALYPNDPETDTTLLIYGRMDPGFIADAQRLVDTGQGFAGLRAVENRLTKSFLLSFLIIYAAVAALTFFAALIISERFSSPVRHLAAATSDVAAGNWDVRVADRTGGEIGKLVDGFNDMVAKLDSQQRRLTDLEKMAAWREFARHLAHEIKNPLLPIRLTVQEMRDRYDGSDEEYRKLLAESGRVVDEELDHLQRLVREFSAFAKMPGLSPIAGSLEKLAADVAALYSQADIGIDTAGAPPPFPFDSDQMRRVIVNLFENAIGMTPKGTKLEIKVSVTREGDSAVLTVADNGPGIPEEDLDSVFEPWFSKRRGGTGLGLAMVKNIILLHGGTIKAENRGGAKFTIALPLAGPAVTNNTEEV
jgi:nitrogen fixation/metabolism regulation signal transduction histidine kinase